MRRFVVLLVLVLVASIASCQVRYESPVDIEWDAPTEGFFSYYEVSVESVTDASVYEVDSPSLAEQLVDLEALGLYGVFTVMVRTVALTDPDIVDFSDWARSDVEADVITVDGEAVVFHIYLGRSAGKPVMMRVR